MQTNKNLQEAFAGESQANRKYTAFARKADEEGKPQIARLFRAVAAAETVHALSHFNVMEGVQDTTANLQEAIKGETYEFTEMYPEFIKVAEEEKFAKALHSFRFAMKVEKVHEGLFSEALAAAKAGKDLEAQDIYVCQYCGHTVVGEAPDRCPVCGRGRDEFKQID